jgi:hypothetical protein
VHADDLPQPPAALACLEALRELSGEVEGPMERHCLRVFLIAERLAGDETFDRDLVLCAAWLHDAGLWCPSDDSYVTEGARLAERILAPFGWAPERLQRCMDACEQHHAPSSRSDLGFEVELIRRADLVDVSGGLVAFGLTRGWLRGVFREVPRDGLAGLLAAVAVRELRHRPLTLPRVFLGPRRTRAQA